MKLTLSHSQINVFNTCEYKWYLRYVEGYSKKDDYNEAADTGTLIHRFLQIWYTTNSLEALAEELKIVLLNCVDSDRMGTIAYAYRIVVRYCTEFAPIQDNFEILGTEVHFEVELLSPKNRPFTVQGYVDLVFKRGNNIFIVDHKTISSTFKSEMQIELDSQLTTYAALLPYSTGPWKNVAVDGVIINQLNRYEYKKEEPVINKLVKRTLSYRSIQQKQNCLISIGHVADAMFDKLESNTPIYRKVLNNDCIKCEFAEACLYEMKGVSPEPFLAQSHKKKITELAIQEEAK
jgi:ATP-dependent helicase/DNAse subunit B